MKACLDVFCQKYERPETSSQRGDIAPAVVPVHPNYGSSDTDVWTDQNFWQQIPTWLNNLLHAGSQGQLCFRTKPSWSSIIQRKLREFKDLQEMRHCYRCGLFLMRFDHNFKIHSLKKSSRLPTELRPLQFEGQLLKEQPMKSCSQENIFKVPADRKYFKFMYNYDYSGKQWRILW